ncbi:unnamed protein product [Closterium sp. NIES-54]
MCGASAYASTALRAREALECNEKYDDDGDGDGDGGSDGGGSGDARVSDGQCPSNSFLGEYYSDSWKLADVALFCKKNHSDWRGSLLRGLFWAVPLLLLVLVPQFAALTSGPRDLTRLVDFPRGVRLGGEGNVMVEIETESGTVTETLTETAAESVTETVTEAEGDEVGVAEEGGAYVPVGKDAGVAENGDGGVAENEDAGIAENAEAGVAENEDEDVDKNGGRQSEEHGNPEKKLGGDEAELQREPPAVESGKTSSREVSEPNQAIGNHDAERANDASLRNENAANRATSEVEAQIDSDTDELKAEIKQRTLGDVERIDSPRVLKYLHANPRLTWETEWLPVRREDYFRPGEKYYFVTGQRDFCAGIRHFHRSLSCKIAEAAFLNRTLVLDMGLCINGMHNGGTASVHGLHYYYDLPSLR